jgi:hypothetical protein
MQTHIHYAHPKLFDTKRKYLTKVIPLDHNLQPTKKRSELLAVQSQISFDLQILTNNMISSNKSFLKI